MAGSDARRESDRWLIDRLCDRFEDAWISNQPRPLEEVLAEAPEEVRSQLFRDLLALERDYRERAGRPLQPVEAQERFGGLGPWAAEALDEAFPAEPSVVLEVTGGPYAGKSFPLAGHTTFAIGRQAGLHVSLPEDRYLSRVHCLIEINLPLARVVDLGGKSGTHVNGRKVASADLRDGDELRAGSTALRVRIPTSAAGATLTLPEEADGPRPEWSDTPPVLLGYRIDAEIGRGAMGVVYRATREATGESVAVKTLLPAVPLGGVALRRFLREADILRQLDHPHIVRFLEAGSSGGLFYFVMEYVDGANAGTLVNEQGPLTPERVSAWAGQVFDALAHAHDRGFVHRDIKPSNLLVLGAPGAETIKVSDFGLARAYEASSMSGLTVANASGGTPAYMPPEQVTDFRYARPAADQYALAATLYFLLTGSNVYEPSPSVQAMLRKILVEDPIPLRPGSATLPGRFDTVIRRGLAREPSMRFADIREMREALLDDPPG